MDLETAIAQAELSCAALDAALREAPDSASYAFVSRIAQLEQSIRSLSARTARAGARSGLWEADGYATAAAWHRTTTRGDHHTSTDAISNGGFLNEHPAWALALSEGRITIEHVSRMRRVVGASAERTTLFAETSDDFLTMATSLTPSHLAQGARALFEAMDPDAADKRARREFQRRQVKLNHTLDGWLLSGWLPDLYGAELAAALNAEMERSRRASDSASEPTPARRADALLELARGHLSGQPASARAKARILVQIPVDRLLSPGRPPRACRGSSGDLLDLAACWTSGNGPGHGDLAPTTVRQLTCDTAVARLLLGPDSQPLDIGRDAYSVPAAMRAALIARDGGCRFPNCDRPPGWADAHHIQHWADGGATALHNLILLCRKHHTVIHHDHRWQIHTSPDQPPMIRRR